MKWISKRCLQQNVGILSQPQCDIATTPFTFCSPGARFTNIFLLAIQIRWKLRLAITPLLAIRSQQTFAHHSIAVVPCTKLCSDHCIGIKVKVKQKFHWVWIAMEKPLVKRAPLYSCRLSAGLNLSHLFHLEWPVAKQVLGEACSWR